MGLVHGVAPLSGVAGHPGAPTGTTTACGARPVVMALRCAAFCRSGGGRRVLARDQVVAARSFLYGAARSSALSSGFALLGESLLAIAPKGTKRSCPYIRPRLRRGSLASVTLRGHAAKGHPWPIAALAASMPLNPLHVTCSRPPERGVRCRLMVRSSANKQSVLGENPQKLRNRSSFGSVGWKTAKHSPPKLTPQSVSNFAFKKRWVSFALPTLRSLEARTTAPLHGPTDTTKLPLSAGRMESLPSFVAWKTAKHFPPMLASGSISGLSTFYRLPTLLHGAVDDTESPLPGGRTQVARKGLSGMDAARAAMGQRWPFAAGPWSVTKAREPRRSRGRMQGQAFLLTFFATEKSESPSRAKPVPQPPPPIGLTPRIPSPKPSRASAFLQKHHLPKYFDNFASGPLNPVTPHRTFNQKRPLVCA